MTATEWCVVAVQRKCNGDATVAYAERTQRSVRATQRTRHNVRATQRTHHHSVRYRETMRHAFLFRQALLRTGGNLVAAIDLLST